MKLTKNYLLLRVVKLCVPAGLGLAYIYHDYFIDHNLTPDEVVLICVVITYLFFLDRASEKLRIAVERERDFAALVSHQIRLPLTQLSWSLDTAFPDVELPEEKRKVIEEMRSIIRSCVKLVGDLLNVSRVERGVLKLEIEEVPLTAFLNEALVTLRAVAKASGAHFEVDVPTELSVFVDKIKAIEALRNIIDNAIKYGPEGGVITITARRQDEDTVSISIADGGPGIDTETQANLFDKSSVFAKKGEGSGAGLGLYLTKHFIELMDGTVRFVTSPKGTTFIVDLPTHKQKE